MFTRKIGKILRGKATPLQIMMACILGAMIGFVPSFATGAGLMIVLLLLLMILNANLGVAAMVGVLGKLVSLLVMPVSFMVGRGLLDGPTQGLFKAMINAPVLALFGFEYYATTGGIVLGLVFGIVCGVLINGSVRRFRKKMAQLEEGSERYQRFTSKKWVKVMLFLFVGGKHGKKTYAEMLEKRRGNPVRIIGVVFALLVVAALYLVVQFASEPIVTMALQRGLERANGATVDVQSAKLDLGNNRLTVTGLAMADPNALDEDIFRAAQIEADVAGSDLLRKRLKLDRVEVSEASSGDKRARRGQLVGPPPEPVGEKDDGWGLNPGEKTIDDYIQTYKTWKERLAQARRWLEKASGEGAGTEAPEKETLSQRLAREIAEKGYARVAATHLIEEAPTLEVSELVAKGVKAQQLEGEVFDVEAQNLSTQPYLVPEAPHVRVVSRSGDILFESGLSASNPSANMLALTLKGLSIDSVAKDMTLAGQPPMKGGTMDVSIDGGWSKRGVGFLDLPMDITLHDTTLTIPGAGSQAVSQFKLPIALRGPMDNPRITIDDKLLGDALVQAGADRLAAEVQGQAGKLLDEAGKKLGDDAGKAVGDALKNLLPGGKPKGDG